MRTDKRGASLTNWTFTIILVLVFLVILQASVLSPMNSIYGADYATGLNTSGLDSFTELKSSTHTTIEGAEATQTSDGLTLKDSWTVGSAIYSTLIDFVSGTFLSNLLTDILDLPPIIATTITVMIWLSLILIIIYIFMKVVP